jgi:hypothetical protein
MCQGIEQIAAVEGPVHLDVLLQRLRDSWNIGRVGPRIRANIEAAIDLADVVRDGGFVTVPERDGAVVRTPVPACARTVEQIADTELAAALLRLVQASAGITQDDLTAAAARLYGWNRRGPDISARLNQLVTVLVADGELQSADHGITQCLTMGQVKREPAPGLGKGQPQGRRARAGRRAGVARLP